jgi:hypothetical protein
MLPGRVAALSGFMDNHERKVMHVEDHDSRYVHFSDGKRVAYVAGDDAPGGARVTGETGGEEPITPSHIRLARDYLIAKGVLQPPPARATKEG